MTRPEFESELAVLRKDSTPAEALKAIALENMNRYENSRQIYTDGSKSEKRVGAAAVVGNKVKKEHPATGSFHINGRDSLYQFGSHN